VIPSGTTRVVGVIGDPVTHSLSPAIHNAAFAACGLDWVYVAFPVPRGQGAEAVAAVAYLGLAGLNVTMPHKAAAAAACDALTADAAALGSVNTVINTPGGLLGDSTDGPGFLAALGEEGVEVAGRTVLVLGAGGAARAVVQALGRAGSEVVVAARRPEAADAAALLAPGARAVALPVAGEEVSAATLVVNATPLGMAGEAPPLDPGLLGPSQAVIDLVYIDTPLLAAARARGARATGGLGMLVHQAALSFTAWTGLEAPLPAMKAAAEAALSAPRPPSG
jgi:shikimate dehydrogenase